ncbi:DUF3107 domain-containing protein [Zhihengliuella salsuginis]|uniref:ATP-binding protein n=1 Tax=Zhihengliuella salsuginis TaxID=578222 RepID=A0ABQ3GGK1_9MICC|nr:DUF3107 domain-containing protein [Zhihengliuella salsuginis]GHD03729.1 hypothetical protein GCM10008096_10130 [Zhihengliuella salsuginis]
MDVRIGIQNVSREVVVDSDQTPDAVAKTVSEALAAGGLLTLTDAKGRQVIVPTGSIGYVEVGSEAPRPVGFAQ